MPPRFVVLGGFNGAGKTTLALRLVKATDFQGAVFLNPDRVTADAMTADASLSLAAAE